MRLFIKLNFVQFTFVWGSQMNINETECFCDVIIIQNDVSQQNMSGLIINPTTEIVLKWGKLDPHILIAVVNAGLTVANIRLAARLTCRQWNSIDDR